MFLWAQDLWPDTLEALGVVKNRLALKVIDKVSRFVYKSSDVVLIQSKAFVNRMKNLVGDDHKDVHYRYMRGGNYNSYELYLRVWVRDSAGPEHTSMSLGFRCARDPLVEEEPEATDAVTSE